MNAERRCECGGRRRIPGRCCQAQTIGISTFGVVEGGLGTRDLSAAAGRLVPSLTCGEIGLRTEDFANNFFDRVERQLIQARASGRSDFLNPAFPRNRSVVDTNQPELQPTP